eukprot:TRINITY_DN449_c0_g2_i1.p1 TRINITY_DN449_c0_g2~~TRINITY_DN449_c0_g2_i1.p1  ORF type:complete len:342 (+),score=65.65 TRINITY_DN449_c0_g2_i1:128-1027(+)
MFAVVFSQIADLDISAFGYVPGSVAGAAAQASGAEVYGAVNILVTDTLAASSATAIATGGGKTAPSPTPTPTPTPTPSTPKHVPPPPKHIPTPPHTKRVPIPTKYHPEPVCEDIHDDKCYSIDTYHYCGFCIVEKYPLKGYACKYTEEVVTKKTSASKKAYEQYETVIVPQCDCAGEFILKGEYCPDCSSLLDDLLQCAGVKDAKKHDSYEISEKCLKEVGVSVKDLVKCGFVHPTTPTKKVVHPPKKDPKIVLVQNEYYHPSPSPKYVPVVAGSTAAASASGKDATASASATATASGH